MIYVRNAVVISDCVGDWLDIKKEKKLDVRFRGIIQVREQLETEEIEKDDEGFYTKLVEPKELI